MVGTGQGPGRIGVGEAQEMGEEKGEVRLPRWWTASSLSFAVKSDWNECEKSGRDQ